jgi:hypothetical protein
MADEVAGQIESIAHELRAKPGVGGYVVGVLDNAPFLFKVVSVEPTVLVFKFRLLTQSKKTPNWGETLTGPVCGIGISSETDAKYLWLWIRKADGLDGKMIAGLARQCVNYYAECFPANHEHCYLCGQARSVSLVQEDNAVALICEECVAKAGRQKAEEERRLNRSSVLFGPLVPLAIGVSALGWALFWILYDRLFEMLGVETIVVPHIVIVIVLVACSCGFGWPVAKLLLRSGIAKIMPRLVVAPLFALATVILGEILFSLFLVYRFEKTLDLVVSLQLLVRLYVQGDWMYTVFRLLFAGGIAVMIYENIEPKKAKLKI